MKKFISLFVLPLCLLASCKTEPISVTGITMNVESISISVGQTIVLEARISPSNADNKTILWSIDNGNVASLSDGTVTGLMAGTATVTAKTDDGGFKATCKVEVTESDNPGPDDGGNDTPGPDDGGNDNPGPDDGGDDNPDIAKIRQIEKIVQENDGYKSEYSFTYDEQNRVTACEYAESGMFDSRQWMAPADYSDDNFVTIDVSGDEYWINLTEFGAASSMDNALLETPLTNTYSGKHLTQTAFAVYAMSAPPSTDILEYQLTINYTWVNDNLISIKTTETSPDGDTELVDSYTMSYSDEPNPFFNCTIDPIEIEIFNSSYIGELMLQYFGLLGSHSKHCCIGIKDNLRDPEDGGGQVTHVEYRYEEDSCTGFSLGSSTAYKTIIYKQDS